LQKLLTSWKYVSHRISAAFAAHEVDWVGREINMIFLEDLKTFTFLVWGGGTVWLTFKKTWCLLSILHSN